MMERLWRSIFKRFFSAAAIDLLFSLLLLSLMLISTVIGLDSAVRGYPGEVIGLMSIVGAAGGLWIYHAGKGKIIVLVLIVFIGLAANFIYFGALFPALQSLLTALLYTLRSTWQGISLHQPADSQPLYLAWVEFSGGSQLVMARLVSWGAGVSKSHAAYDQFSANFLWGVQGWLSAVWAGWAWRHFRSPMYSAAPSGSVLVISLNYTGGDARYLLPFFGLIALWLCMYSYLDARKSWETRHIDYAEDLTMDISLSSIVITACLLAVGMMVTTIPEINLQDITGWFSQARLPASNQPQDVALSLGLQRPTPSPNPFQRQNVGSLPREHLLGAGPELSKKVVMSIQVVHPPGEAPPSSTQEAPRYYWRSLTYDEYTGLGWKSSAAVETGVARGDLLPGETSSSQYLLEQEVRLVNSQDIYLYASGRLVSVNQGFRAAWRPIPGEDPEHPLTDLFGARLDSKTYRALSYVNIPEQSKLLGAVGEYPEWIIARYLQLPKELPGRVLELAGRLASAAPTPYRRAKIIESYVRSFPYTLDLPAPPQDRDVVDYYLFDLKRGYCDYAASAMVVLARAAGLPARLVVGYAPGAYDIANDRYLVSAADAHSWPEVYFSGVGWVEFEPTGGLPELKMEPVNLAAVPPALESERLAAYRLPIWPFAAGGAATILLAILAWVTSSAIRMGRLSPHESITEIYHRFQKPAQRLVGSRLTPGFTPLELAAAALAAWLETARRLEHFQELARRVNASADCAADQVNRLMDLYNRAQYSAQPASRENARQAIQIWLRVRLPLWFAARIAGFAGKLIQSNQPTESETPIHDNP